MGKDIMTSSKQLIFLIMNVFFCLELYFSEWWEVVLSGDRCLYPDSFHIFVSEICVGSLHSEHQALCLPLSGAEELFRLPPTDDRTIFSYNVLDVLLRFLFIIPFLIVVIQHQNPNDYASNIIVGAVHFGGAVLLGVAILVVTLAPTASSHLWAEGVLTCDVSLKPGPGPMIAFSGMILELIVAVWYLNG
jgi:hypothetical protein